jgi:hypothetical protein
MDRQPSPNSPPAFPPSRRIPCTTTLHALVGQRQALLSQQLESEAIYLDRLRKLHTAESEMREAARSYDSFLEKHLFWLGTQSRTQPDDVLRLPDEVRLLLAPARRSDLVRAFEQQVFFRPCSG